MAEYHVELTVKTGQIFPKTGETIPCDRSLSGEAQITEVAPHQTLDEWLDGKPVIRATLKLKHI